MQKIYLMKDRKIKGRAKGKGWRQEWGAVPREGMALREEGVALMEGTASPPHEKKTLATKQNVKFIY